MRSIPDILRLFMLYYVGLLINSSVGTDYLYIASVHRSNIVHLHVRPTNEQAHISFRLTGILLAEVVKHEHTSYLSFRHYVVWSLLLVSGVLLTFTGITILGLDPLWSLGLAKKWCAKSEWVHPDTTPFFAFVRDVSSLLGKFKYLFCSLKISAESAFLKRGKDSLDLSV